MDGLLTEIKTVKKVQSNIDRFENLSIQETTKHRSNSSKSKRSLIEISSSNASDSPSEPFHLQPSIASSRTSLDSKPTTKRHKRHDSTAFLQQSYLQKPGASPASLPDDAREILRTQPDHEDLIAVLQYLRYGIENKHDFNVHVAGPKAAQIINVMVTVTLPDQWHNLRSSKLSDTDRQLQSLLVLILRSLAGIGALLMQIRSLSARKENTLLAADLLSVLDNVIRPSQTLHSFLRNTSALYSKESQRKVYWQEVTSLFCGSKILSTVSQAIVTNSDLVTGDHNWLSDGNQFSAWLANNISACATRLTVGDSESWIMLSQAMKRAMSLGYRDSLISSLYSSLLLDKHALWTPLQQLLRSLPDHDQRTFFDGMLIDLVRKYLRQPTLSNVQQQNGLETEAAIGGVAAMIIGLVTGNQVLEEQLERWLTSSIGQYPSLGLDTRRAVVATLSLRQEKLQRILERCLENFGDKLQIQHNPILQQQSTAETMLLIMGYLYRCDPDAVRKISKSGIFLQCISNRLAASVPQARLLGMTVAVGVSRLVDTPDKLMDFGSDEIEGQDQQRLLELVHLHDKVGKIEDLKDTEMAKPIAVVEETAEVVEKRKRVPEKLKEQRPQASKIISIEEVESEDEDDDDLVPYEKPDDDPSDSDEDPTLINRSKPSAPVYIIDLIKQLQTDDKPEVIELALRTAPDLICRKANFGTELSDNVQAVASSLLNLKDGMSDHDLQDLRLQSLIACLVSKPSIIGPWLVSMYFEGDFSLAQRATILSTIGLAARQLSGHKDTANSEDPSTFPSKQLPARLAAIYAPTNTIVQQIEHSTLQPLALAAADKLSGPDVLKVRTFSSRLDVQRKTAAKQAERSKRIPNDLHRLLSEFFYLPLCCRMSLLLSSSVNISRSTIFESNIVRLLLQTLTIIIHCLGPNAAQLETVTRETLLLLVPLHNTPSLACDPVVLPALLQLLLTLLDINVQAGSTAEQRLVTDFGSMLADIISWAGSLADGVANVPVLEKDAGEMGMNMPWTVLVAGIQVKWHEIGRKFQGRMMGLMGVEDMEGF